MKIPESGILKLLLDIAKVPLIDTHTLKLKVPFEYATNPEYLVMTLISNGINFVSLEDLKQAKHRYKIEYTYDARIYKKRSKDMDELIQLQRQNRKNR